MAKIWIWNSMATRRRSASDIFEENGIRILKSYLEANNHELKIIDWANTNDYKRISPFWDSLINHVLCYLSEQTSIKFIHKIKSKRLKRFQVRQEKKMRKRLDYLAREVANEKLRFFGMKLWYGEAFSWAKYLCDKIHKYSPETIVMAGGYHTSLYREHILEFSNFDIAVTGEGEKPLQSILDLLDKNEDINRFNTIKLHEIPGLIFRRGKQIVLNSEIPKRSHFIESKSFPVYEKNSGKTKIHILMESLGCPWNKCYFCVHNQLTPQYQQRRIRDLIQEIREMIKQGIGVFRFAGSDTPPAFGKEIAKAILDAKLKIHFSIGSRVIPNSSRPEIYRSMVEAYELMLRAGLKAVFIGGESGNEKINDQVMNKGVSQSDIEYTMKAMHEAERNTGIKLFVSLALIYPNPVVENINLKTVREDNLSLIDKLQPNSVMITPPGPFIHSQWNEKKEKFGFELSKDFTEKMMEYEYVLYKPLHEWDDLEVSLDGKNFKELLIEAQSFRNEVSSKLHIPTDISDEHFLMMHCMKATNMKDILRFKRKSMRSILSAHYSYLNKISKQISRYSEELSNSNELQLNAERNYREEASMNDVSICSQLQSQSIS